MKRLRTFLKRKQPGFSIGEVVLAAFVLTSGIIATVLLISKSITYSIDAREATTAAGLAEEGIELMRAFRNNEFLQSGNDGLDYFWSNQNRRNCRISYNWSSPDCQAGRGNTDRYLLQYDQSRSLYQSSSVREKYIRYIYTDFNSSQRQVTIRSFVFWDYPWNGFPSFIPTNGDPSQCTLVNRCVYTEGVLTNWGQQ